MTEINNYLSILLNENELSVECLLSHVENLKGNGILSTMDENCKKNKLVPLINSKLHNAEYDRRKALHILHAFVPHCSREIFTDQSVFWMRQCCKWNSPTVNEELVLLRSMIQNSISNPDIKKEVISDIIPRFFEQLCRHKDPSARTVNLRLLCLKTIADLYGPACTQYRGDMNKFVMYCLKEYSQTKTVLQNASDCFVSLCQCCGKGQEGINHKESWTAQFTALLNTCHKLFDVIYDCVDVVKLSPDSPRENVIESLLELKTTYEMNALTRFHCWEMKFAIISRLLRSMMMRAYPTTKSFQPNDVFGLLCRVFSVNGKILEKCAVSNDVICLNTSLHRLHGYAFDILRSFILCGKRNLIPYGTLICRLCLLSLKLIDYSNTECSSTLKPFEQLRCKVYQTLQCWISLCGSCCCVELFADEIIPIVIADIEVAKRTVKLNTVSEASKKRKRKNVHYDFHSDIINRTDSSVMNDIIPNEMICVQAHRAVQTLLESASSLIKCHHYKNLQYTTIALLLEITNVPSSNQAPFPYSNSDCRLELYKTMLVLTFETHPDWRVPIALAEKIFAFGLRDCDAKISHFCRTAVLRLESLIHPRGYALAIPPTLEDEPSKNDESFEFEPLIQPRENAVTITSSKEDDISENVTPSSELESIHPRECASTITPLLEEKFESHDSTMTSNLTVETIAPIEDEFSENVEQPTPELSINLRECAPTINVLDANESPQNAEPSNQTIFDVLIAKNTDEIEMDVDQAEDLIVDNPDLASMLNDFVDTTLL